jgi:putative transposase
VIEPHLPPPAKCGRTRETDLREVMNAIFYIAQTACQWRLLPCRYTLSNGSTLKELA